MKMNANCDEWLRVLIVGWHFVHSYNNYTTKRVPISVNQRFVCVCVWFPCSVVIHVRSRWFSYRYNMTLVFMYSVYLMLFCEIFVVTRLWKHFDSCASFIKISETIVFEQKRRQLKLEKKTKKKASRQSDMMKLSRWAHKRLPIESINLNNYVVTVARTWV